MKKLQLLTATACLCLAAACNQTNSTAEEANGLAENGGDVVLADDGANAEDLDEAVAVVEVPAPVGGTAAAVAAPLTEAANLSRRIGRGAGIERVPYEGGWGWRENGQIVRTSSRDGRRVSYFRPGASTPYLVQQGDRAFAYTRGRVERGYDGRGRAVEIDRSRREEGERLARDSAEQRRRANRVASEQPERIRRERPAADRQDETRRRSEANGSRDAADRNSVENGAGRESGRGADDADRPRRSRTARRPDEARTHNEMTPRTH